MSYTKRADIPTPAGWIAVEFDDGTFARVRCDRKTVEGGVNYFGQAQAIDADGIDLVDVLGRPIATGFKHTSPVAQVEQLGDGAITLAVLLLVMGESTDTFPWKDSIRNGPMTNIRAARAAASVAGTADSGAVL